MLGSVFSPYYAWARSRGSVDPLDHCGLNVALYPPGRKRWALTERGRARLQRNSDWLCIGRSSLLWDGQSLTVDIHELTAPIPSRIRGRVKLHPSGWASRSFALDAAGAHRWWPVAPLARIEVALERPRLRWQGTAYWDSNWGSSPLEEAFSSWHWSRSHLGDGATAILYDVQPRVGPGRSLALRGGADCELEDFEAPPQNSLPATLWRVPRSTRSEPGSARVLRTLEDTPFYARSLVSSRLLGESGEGVQESLSLERFRQRWVQVLLPFRMPRKTS